MPFLMQNQYGDGNWYFYQETISTWLLTKAEEKSTYPWDEDFTLPGINLAFQEVSWVTQYREGGC